MHPAHEAALNTARASFAQFDDVFAGLPDEALRWKPVEQGNTIQVLATHCITATRFWMNVGCGIERSLAEYRAGEREASFAAVDRTGSQLRSDMTAYLAELEADLETADGAALSRVYSWADVADSPVANGYEALMRAVAHLREHVGEAQLTRDLWLAKQ